MFTEILIALIIFALARLYLQKQSDNSKYPPGPWGLPIVGHLLLLGSNPCMKMIEWSKTYGPILFVRFGSMPTVVLNDAKLIKEAFLKDEFSGRPLLKIFVEASNKKGIVFSDGPLQVEQRRFSLTNLRDFGFGTGSVEVRIQDELVKFLKNTESKVGKPLEINNFFRFPIINSFWDLIMGSRFDEKDPTINEFIEHVDNVTNSTTYAAQLSFYVPWFGEWFGFLGYNKNLAAFKAIYTYMDEQIKKYKKTHVQGTQKDFTGVYLNKVSETTDLKSSFHPTAGHQPIATGDLFAAALDTSTKTLDWLLIHMARNPEIQKKLQAEIDEVVGDSRLPSLSDRNKMPYTEAVMYETLRMSPTVPLGVPHGTLQDVEFHGYVIPKGTMIISNIYGVHHNPAIWDKPKEFQPKRFLDTNGKFKKPQDYIPFSSGKRICVGEQHAKDNIFLVGASFFQKFSVSCSKNVPEVEGKFQLVLAPEPCDLILHKRI